MNSSSWTILVLLLVTTFGGSESHPKSQSLGTGDSIVTLDAQVIAFPQTLAPPMPVQIAIRLRNNLKENVVIPLFVSDWELSFYDSTGSEVERVEILEPIIGIDNSDRFKFLKPGESAVISMDIHPKMVLDSKTKLYRIVDSGFARRFLKPGHYSCVFDKATTGLEAVQHEGKMIGLSQLFPTARCSVAFRTNPVIVHVE